MNVAITVRGLAAERRQLFSIGIVLLLAMDARVLADEQRSGLAVSATLGRSEIYQYEPVRVTATVTNPGPDQVEVVLPAVASINGISSFVGSIRVDVRDPAGIAFRSRVPLSPGPMREA